VLQAPESAAMLAAAKTSQAFSSINYGENENNDPAVKGRGRRPSSRGRASASEAR
jgi:hypothetical protein